MNDAKRILFGGYAPVHFLCFRPVYELLRREPGLDVWLTGGFRHKDKEAGETRYELDGFYEPYGVDLDRVAPFEDLANERFDAVVMAHSSTVFFPESYGRSVEIFHGVSFKNFSVREKVLKYDYACVVGNYHASRFASQGILGAGETQFFLTGFPKLDRLVSGELDRDALLSSLGLSPARPTILYAPTGGKYNSLDEHGEAIVRALDAAGKWNLLVKPHDHPKKAIDWNARLAALENDRLRVVRDFDVVPCLHAADLLLTDASSVSMEYALVDRPIVFFDVPKLLANVTERGGALDLDTYGRKIGDVAAGVGDLVPTVEKAFAEPNRHSALRRAAADDLFHAPGSATENVAAVVKLAAGVAGVPEHVPQLTARGATG